MTTTDSPWDIPGHGASESAYADAVASAADWLDAPVTTPSPAPVGGLGQWWDGSLPVQSWINEALAWIVADTRPYFQLLRVPIDNILTGVESALQSVTPVTLLCVVGLLAWQCAGVWVAVGTLSSLLLLGVLGLWQGTMVTLSLVLTSLVFCLLLGLPMGIVLANSRRVERVLRPLLDAMQTTPAFVYLVPVVMLFGIGNVPGVMVTIIFAVVPLVRLTCLGIRQVRPDLIEAARAYGASPWQLLTRLQLPLALPSIMAGVNQTLMLALSMVVIASMIGVGGLGQMVLRGIGRLDMGLATVGGLGIVMLAMMLDRITQAMGRSRRDIRRWWHTGPAGLLWRLQRAVRQHRTPTAMANLVPSVQGQVRESTR